MKKEDVICDYTTGICGSAERNEGIMEFVDLTAAEEKDSKEENKEKEQ